MNKLKEGQIIEVNVDAEGVAFVPARAKVAALLSVQFTALVMDGTDTMKFLFYNDEGATWREVND